MTAFVLIVKPDGTRERITVTKPPELHEVQAWVGGDVEACNWISTYEGQPAQFYLDEEGKLKGKPLNPLATLLLEMSDDYVAGDLVILCGRQALWD